LARRKVLFVFGTRPEAIKLARVIHRLRDSGNFDISICVTAQHRQMLDQVLGVFNLVPDFDLNVMSPGQTLAQSTGRILTQLEPVLDRTRPDLIVVQGDTTSTFCGALTRHFAL